MTYSTDHYVALLTNLSNEKQRLENSASEAEYQMRSVWVRQLEREIAHEVEFLASKGVCVYSNVDETDDLTDDELMALLSE